MNGVDKGQIGQQRQEPALQSANTNDSVFMFITRSCNLTCSHCYVSAGPRLKGNMSLDIFGEVVDYFLRQGINDFRLTGGEPTFHPEFDLMLDLLSTKGITPRLITNGIRLMKMQSPQFVLEKVSKCWISAYGVNKNQHRAIGGERSLALEDILEFVGRQTMAGHWVGISVLLTEVSLDDLENFLVLAKKYGVRYLRFLFAEPTGRAMSSKVAFAYGDRTRDQAKIVFDYLDHSITSDAFDFLSLNNPFDLNTAHKLGLASCMLGSRSMWSISPEGDIYSCCFNIYDPVHKVTNVLSDTAGQALSNNNLVNNYAHRCKGLNSNYWGSKNSAVACPISALTLSRSR
ncbi:MAG: radical SAM protein [Gallionella sp.]|nr:radical SAM protein [Gallionella sp.]